MAVDDEDEKFKQIHAALKEKCEQKLNATAIPGKPFLLIYLAINLKTTTDFKYFTFATLNL